MGATSSINKTLDSIEEKNEENKVKILNDNYKKSLNLKKKKEEEEKNSLLKINKKWENKEKEDIKNSLNNIRSKKKIELDKIITEKEEKIVEEESKDDKDLNNLTEEEKILNEKFKLIEKQGNSFLDGEITNLYNLFKYTLEVSRYIGEEMNYIKKKYPDNLISPNDAVSDDNYIVEFLGYLGGELSLYKITTLIEKKPSNEIIRDITFKMIVSGLATQRVYKLILDSEEDRIKFGKDTQLWNNYIQNIRCRIEAFHNLGKNEIYFFNQDNTNFEVLMIIYNKRLNGIEYTLRHLKLKVLIGNLLNNIILSPNMFFIEYCKEKDSWPKGDLKRGGEEYYPPYGWEGFAIKLRNRFGNKYDWLGKKGKKKKEWCVAFHGIGKGDEFKKVFSILNTNLREGPKQRFSTHENIRDYTKEEYKRCGKGVYLTPDIKKAENYAHKIKLGKFNKDVQFAIQARVNPKRIRDPGRDPINWILNGNDNEVRPYRLLVKIS